MNNMKCIVLIGLVAFAMVAILPFSGVATPTQAEVSPVNTRATQTSYVVASAHNYANSYTYTWPAKTVSGATQIRVHFTRIELEATYDKIYILNSAGSTVQTFGATSATSTYASGVWSSWVTGTTFSIKLTTDSSVTKWGFATDLVEYETGTTPPPPPTNVLTNGVASSGSLASVGATATWTIAVPSGCTQMYSVLTCGSADFDLYGKLGSAPTTSVYDWRGYTSGGEEVTQASPGAGTWYIMVVSYSGTGAYQLTCTLTTGSADTTAPTVSITSPANGATVSGSVTVTVSASDNVGVTSTAISIDGGAYTTSLTWATTSVADGSHTIQARAQDAAGNSGYSSTITVTVKNTVTPPPTTVLTSGVAASGSLTTSGATAMWTIVVNSNCVSMVTTVNDPTTADFDSYGMMGAQPTTSSYTWRGYTSSHPEVVTYANPVAGTWYIMVKSYSGTGAYTITCTLTYGTTPPPPTGDKFAVIVGISNYKSINDLSYCDEDATDWFNYLVNVCGYSAANIRILGDGGTYYPQTCWGKATEANYKACLTWLFAHSGAEVAFITSGHGSGDGAGESYICAWDCSSGESGEDGNFYDHELAALVGAATASKIFIFVDHCYSGGLGPELMALSNKAAIFCSTTCTANGYGYDEPSVSNGAWTAQFVHTTLEQHFGSSAATTMEAAQTYAASGYSHTGGDAAMVFDGNTGSSFTI
jgi:hypothetical protein